MVHRPAGYHPPLWCGYRRVTTAPGHPVVQPRLDRRLREKQSGGGSSRGGYRAVFCRMPTSSSWILNHSMISSQ
jgi:hypothetical protein